MNKKQLASILTILILAGSGAYLTIPDTNKELVKVYDTANKTMIVSTHNNKPYLTIQQISFKPDITTCEEVFSITSYINHPININKDFKVRWHQFRGNHSINKAEWFILKNQSYNVSIPNYELVEHCENVTDNETLINHTICWNQTEITSTHNETRYRNVWKPFSPAGKILHANKQYTIKVIFHKLPELGSFAIQTIPTFAGFEEHEFSWWNQSWSKKVPILINNTGGSALSYYPLSCNITYDSDMQPDFDDIRFINVSASTSEPYWIEKKSDSNWCLVRFNATYISGGGWSNDTTEMYYDNPSASSASNGTNTFIAHHGTASANFHDSNIIPAESFIYEAKVRATVDAVRIAWGVGTVGTIYNGDGGDIIRLAAHYNTNTYFACWNDGIITNSLEVDDFTLGTWYKLKIEYDFGVSGHGYKDSNEISTGLTTNLPDEIMGLAFEISTGSGEQEWSFARKYTTPEPTSQLGAEESSGLVLTTGNISNIKYNWGISFNSNFSANVTNASASNVWMNFSHSNFTNTSLGTLNIGTDEWVNESHNISSPITNTTVTVTLTSSTSGTINDTDTFYYEITKRSNTATMDSPSTQTANITEPFYINATAADEHSDTFYGAADLLEDGAIISTDSSVTNYVNFSHSESSAGTYNYTIRFYNLTHYTNATTSTYSNVTISDTITITAYSNEYIILNNWSTDQSFLQIDNNLTNDYYYTYYNGTEFLSYMSGYNYNNDNTIPKNESIMISFTSDTTLTTHIQPVDINIIGNRWFYTFLPDYTSKILSTITTSMTADGGDIWELYGWDNSSSSYNSTDAFTVNPNEGILVYANATFVWTNT